MHIGLGDDIAGCTFSDALQDWVDALGNDCTPNATANNAAFAAAQASAPSGTAVTAASSSIDPTTLAIVAVAALAIWWMNK